MLNCVALKMRENYTLPLNSDFCSCTIIVRTVTFSFQCPFLIDIIVEDLKIFRRNTVSDPNSKLNKANISRYN